MKNIAFIPARLASSRFPNKVLADIHGKTMLQCVFDGIQNCGFDEVYITTCDNKIIDVAASFGASSILTSNKHERCLDRVAEAYSHLSQKYDSDNIYCIQGDEPMTHPNMITEAVSPMLKDSEIIVTNLLGDIKSQDEFEDRNCIKVVCDLDGNALCFSREPIPTRMFGEVTMKKQVCIIPFTRDFLLEYTKLSPTPLEIFESIDMMRILEHGKKVKMIPTNFHTHPVDTEDDLLRVESLISQMKNNE